MTGPVGTPRPLEALLAELAEAEGGAGDHPDPRRLLDYHAGALRTGEEAALREHLTVCRICTAALLDLAAFDEAESPAAPAPAADFETAAAWRAFEPRLAAGAGRWRGPRAWLPWVAAAGLLAASAGLAWRVVDVTREQAILEAEVAALAAPRPDLPVLYLQPPTRSGYAGAAPVVELARGDYLALVLLPPPEPWLERYRVEVADDEDRTIWNGTLAPSAEGGLRLGLPARLLPPGGYRVRLRDDPADPPLAVYELAVAHRDP